MAGAWAALSRRDTEEKPPFFDLDERIGRGPKSSPDLPEGTSGEPGGRGRPVVLGPAVRDLKRALEKGPVRVEAAADVSPAPEKSKERRPPRVRHKVDDIIARSSKDAHHRRALQNAESLLERGKAAEAKAIYERVKNRVDDPEIQRKLQENIEDIDRWLEGIDEDEEHGGDEVIRFPQIVIPLSTQAVALENLTEGLRRVSESLVDQVNVAAARLAFASGPLTLPSGFGPAGPTGGGPAGGSAAPAGGAGSGGGGGGPVIIVQGGSPGGPAAGGAMAGGATVGGAAAGVGAAAGTAAATGAGAGIAGTTVATAPIQITGPVTIMAGAPAFPAAGTPAYTDRLRMDVPAPHAGDGELLTGTVDIEWAEGSFQPVARKGTTDDSLPPGFTVDEDGNLITDGWTDEDFERMWEKFKNLPLKDRRSGLDRRVHIDRRRDKKKDRRSGVERRKNDLFKEREEFLKKLEEHKRRKKELEDWKKRHQDRKAKIAARGKTPKPGEPQIVIEHANVTIGDVEGLEGKQPAPPPPPPEPEKKPEPPKPPEPAEMLVRQAPPELEEIGFPSAEEARFEPEMPREEEEPAGAPEPEAAEPAAEEEPGEGVESFSAVPALDESLESDFEPREEEQPTGPVQEIRGVLELKPPDEDDAPFLTLTYDFSKIPDSFQLSRDYNTMEYAYYKYKPMLLKAQEFTRRKMLKNALNYYRVIKSQAIPPEMKRMINRNIQDITEYLEKFLMSRE